MTRLLDGYVELSVNDVTKYCKATIEYIKEIQMFDDREFLNWAIPYFNETACRKKSWHFWRPKPFDNKDKFLKWFWNTYRYGGFIEDHPVEAAAFSKVSSGFSGSDVFFYEWYVSDFGSVSLKVCERLLPEAKKLPPFKNILLSLEDFKAITKSIKG